MSGPEDFNGLNYLAETSQQTPTLNPTGSNSLCVKPIRS